MKNRVRVTELQGREIYNRAGRKAIECDVCTIQGQFRAGVSFYRDATDEKEIKAAKNIISHLHPALLGKYPEKQAEIDKLLKVSENARHSIDERMTILAISMAVCRAGALAKQRPLRDHIRALAKMEKLKGEKASVLPLPVISVLDTTTMLPFKEFDIIPIGAKNIAEALDIGSAVYTEVAKKLREKLDKSEMSRNVETGAMNVEANSVMTEVKDVLKLLELAVKETGFEEKVVFHISVAADRLYHGRTKSYNIGELDDNSKQEEKNSEKMLSSVEFLKFVLGFTKECPMFRSMSNPLATKDPNFKKITKELGGSCKVGYSIFSLQDFQRGCEEEEVNHAFISPFDTLKLRNIYTVTDLISVIMSAKKQEKTITLEDLCLTENDFLTDLAVGLELQVFKAGKLDRYNQLLRIEEELGPKTTVASLFPTDRRF